MLVYTTGRGVYGFTLDPSIGEFCLSHSLITTPTEGKIYSVNEGNIGQYSPGVRSYIAYCQANDKETGRPYSGRYIGSLVADFHRNLMKGGIYMYPPTAKAPNGKLRLLYEQAGGLATDGKNPILDIVPETVHQRTPLFIGSASMVRRVMDMMAQEE